MSAESQTVLVNPRYRGPQVARWKTSARVWRSKSRCRDVSLDLTWCAFGRRPGGFCLTSPCPKTEPYSLFTILELVLFFPYKPTGRYSSTLDPSHSALPAYPNLNMVAVVRSVRSSRSRCLTTPHIVCRMKIGPDNPEQCVARYWLVDACHVTISPFGIPGRLIEDAGGIQMGLWGL